MTPGFPASSKFLLIGVRRATVLAHPHPPPSFAHASGDDAACEALSGADTAGGLCGSHGEAAAATDGSGGQGEGQRLSPEKEGR